VCGLTFTLGNVAAKIPWKGELISVQPRIRLSRSFDQRSHTYLGYALRLRGTIGSEAREFLIGVGGGAHAKHQFRVGDTVSGNALPVADPRLETVEFYKISNLRVSGQEAAESASHPHGVELRRRLPCTGSAVIGGSQYGPIRTSARAVYGDARWRWR
jgi:hypothetical protein